MIVTSQISLKSELYELQSVFNEVCISDVHLVFVYSGRQMYIRQNLHFGVTVSMVKMWFAEVL